MKARKDEKTQPNNNGGAVADINIPLDNRVGAGQNLNKTSEDLWWVPLMVLVVIMFIIPVLFVIGIVMGWL